MHISNEHTEYPCLSITNYFVDREEAVQCAQEILTNTGSFHALTMTITPEKSGAYYVVTATSLWSADTEIQVHFTEPRNI